ncbi:MAG: hypothetical protein PUC47_09280 [Oscillospiraceae bacterium]|nr:hypothetical protein [Oscillospiraceae bacterium]
MNSANNHQYDDIIHLPHHVSATRPQMSMMDRAAQFSPFAALTGYDAAIKEAARLTDRKIELDDCEKEEINGKIQLIAEHLGEDLGVVITCFQPDSKKAGGAYVDALGIVKKIDAYERMIIFRDGRKVPIDDILWIELAEPLSLAVRPD